MLGLGCKADQDLILSFALAQRLKDVRSSLQLQRIGERPLFDLLIGGSGWSEVSYGGCHDGYVGFFEAFQDGLLHLFG